MINALFKIRDIRESMNLCMGLFRTPSGLRFHLLFYDLKIRQLLET